MEYLTYLGVFVVGFFLGMRFMGYSIKYALKSIAEKNGIPFNEVTDPQETIPIFVTEPHENTILLYDKLTNKFICQGVSLEDLASKVVEYKHITLAAVSHNKEVFWFINGKVRTSEE